MDLPGELEALCRACGFCCDGTLFGRGSLAPEEVEGALRHHLRVVPQGSTFEQPCSAHQALAPAEKSCAIYADRPATCRRFTCTLFERHKVEGRPLAERLERVREVRALLEAHRYRTAAAILDVDFARSPLDAKSNGSSG